MKKILLLTVTCYLLTGVAEARIGNNMDRFIVIDTENNAQIPVAPDNIGSPGTAVFRAMIQTASVDWEAISGLRIREFRFNFTNTRVAGSGRWGWELYYLDEFPCVGSGQWVRTWVNQQRNLANSSLPMRANCIIQPTQVRLAWRRTQENEWQGRTDGVLTCNVDRNMNINLEQCINQTWAEFQRDGPARFPDR